MVNVLCSVYRKTLEMTGVASKEVNQAAAGISISLDKIVSALQDDNYTPAIDVVVCSVGHQSMLKEKAAVIRELWAAGIKSSLMDSLQVHSSSLLMFCIMTDAVLCKLWHVGGGLCGTDLALIG
jgi:translation initiation factor 2-alpha kinase 4